MDSWHIVTGEYPRAPGGVSDYTQSVARALARAGDDVHVWAPGEDLFEEEKGIELHPLPDHFGRRSIVAIAKGLAADPNRNKRILLQYVPQAFGLRGMNLPFCAALACRREELWVMFHELFVVFERGRSLRRHVLAATTHAMAGVLAYRADRLFASTPSWNELLRARFPGVQSATWLPIPSNISSAPAPQRMRALRATLSEEGKWDLVGHFGTYGALITPLLEKVLVRLLEQHPRAKVLLLGRSGEAFGRDFAARFPELGARTQGTGPLSDEDVALHLAACDLVIQPYPDGVSSRRTSVMASLMLGVPVVTNEGWLSEPIWRDEASVALAGAVPPMADLACDLLTDRPRALELGERGQRLYDRFFSLENTIRTLRAPA